MIPDRQLEYCHISEDLETFSTNEQLHIVLDNGDALALDRANA
jgi:hypothetical protein